MMEDHGPHITRVIGTPEFVESWKGLEAEIQRHLKDRTYGSKRIKELAELACRQAYLDGFNEGLSK